jgi:hypothetical protein
MGAGQRWVLATVSQPVHAGNEDGGGESICHRFAHSPETIQNDDTGDVAEDPQRLVPAENVHLRSGPAESADQGAARVRLNGENAAVIPSHNPRRPR